MPTNIENAGNVIYKELKFRMSMRLAPTHDSTKIVELLKSKFTEKKDDTFGAVVEFSVVDAGDGFSAPDLPKDVKDKFYQSTREVFENQEPMFVGCGGSIPFMEVFSK
mmetsp:Transcript_3073/g.2050  ORF Transcript_3073/g.2050 Transcript_3073/m.2050 type:complete len:108 (-) Transcript_3073:176-499(-)|eukprot:CAMPEP_0116872260 /NCGR_PEP_ID=MMETSP0463-20121206/2976_1 /TAXON_ID=181622 /ORGANISM="Strombidinopsis sp, Strain SopsisLIS2011" /LENGTH=107 /DNA_ID=CAMNT_0004512235 /DNA_START=1023 /DNA_END=1346 /DNA_ORIENTATION=-